MYCRECNTKMYVENKIRNSSRFVCPNCGFSIFKAIESFVSQTKMIDPEEYNTDQLKQMTLSGDIGLNQIPLPDRLDVKKKLKEEF